MTKVKENWLLAVFKKLGETEIEEGILKIYTLRVKYLLTNFQGDFIIN